MIINKKHILIVLVLILIKVYMSKCEHFKDTHFYTLEKSINIMTNPEYFKFFNDYDFKLRNLNDIDDCIKKYKTNTLEYNKEEKNNLNNLIKKLKSKLTKYNNVYENVKFIKVNNLLESGLPHTREKAIVFSENWLDTYLNSDFNMFFIRLISHEQFHVFQRYNPKLMEILYTKYWGMIKFNSLPKELMEINRTNPDALPDNFWLFKIENDKYILPLCIYYGNKNSIRDTKNVYFNLFRKNKKLIFTNLKEEMKNIKLLNENKSYKDFFGSESSNNYHPNELSASLFEILIKDNLENNTTDNIPALKELDNFLLNEIKN